MNMRPQNIMTLLNSAFCNTADKDLEEMPDRVCKYWVILLMKTFPLQGIRVGCRIVQKGPDKEKEKSLLQSGLLFTLLSSKDKEFHYESLKGGFQNLAVSEDHL